MPDYPMHRYSVSQISQGSHRFYTLTMPSDVLAKCCFVTTRDEDPQRGFQRVLDEKRALEIATYIDEGLGTIPSSIVLSAQPDAQLKIVGRGKTLEFEENPKAFLVLDGQHRVYGFSKAKSNLRVPVVIYNALSRQDESRLFIDINSKQKGVPPELLLDIKKLADYETDTESRLREIYDLFMKERGSILKGVLSPSKRATDMISRVTFNGAIKPLLSLFSDKSSFEAYNTLNNYIFAFSEGLKSHDAEKQLANSIVFRAITSFFPEVATKVKDRYGSDYSTDNFFDVLTPMFSRMKPVAVKSPGNSYKSLKDNFTSWMATSFSL